MYGFDQKQDWSFLKGLQLNQVAFGQYQTELHFGGGAVPVVKECTIGIEGGISISIDGAAWKVAHLLGDDAPHLLSCLGQVCLSCTAPERKMLDIVFANAVRLRLHDDSEQFECVVINLGKEIIII